MEFLKISDITIPSYRQRSFFDEEKLAELTSSIIRTGLLQAIVVRDDGTLVAGERRLRAITDAHFLAESLRHGTQIIPHDHIPVLRLSALTHEQALEAELEENTIRADLTWQELAAAREQLHNLRVLQAETSGAEHTLSDTAEEIAGTRSGGPAKRVIQSIHVMRNLASVPEAAKAKTQDEAMKIIKRHEQKQAFAKLGAEVAEQTAESRHTLIHGNALTVLYNSVHTGKYDIILTDPPYGMGADSFGDSGGEGRSVGAHEYDDSYESWLELMGKFLPLTIQVTKQNAALYMFCDFDRFVDLRVALSALGWIVHRTPIIMVKQGNSGRVPWPKFGPRRQYEVVLYAYRGLKYTNHIGLDVVYGTPIANRIGHPAEKPGNALRDLLLRSLTPGDEVLDPFCGSGSIFPEVHAAGGLCTGIELDASFHGMAVSKLGELE